MRIERSVTSISWIPSGAMTGPMRVPMDLGVGHYDSPPPDRVDPADLARMRDEDMFRFANHLGAWIEVEDGEIVGAGYLGDASRHRSRTRHSRRGVQGTQTRGTQPFMSG